MLKSMQMVGVRISLLLLGFLTIQGYGQGPGQTPEQRAQMLDRQMAELKERLSLTPEQEERVRPVFERQMERLEQGRERFRSSGQSEEARRAARGELEKIQAEMDAELKGILSEEQMGELQKYREERRQQMRERARQRQREGS